MGPARIYPCRKMHRSRAPSIAPGTFFVAQPWADCITNITGFNLRQAHQRQLLDFHTLLLKDAGMLIQAIGAAVDLGYAKINKLDKHVREARLQDIAIYSTAFTPAGATFVVVDTYAHERVSLSIRGGEFFIRWGILT